MFGIHNLVSDDAPSGNGAPFRTENPPPWLTQTDWPSLDRHQFIYSLAALGCAAVLTTPAADAVTGMPSVGYITFSGAPFLIAGMTALDCTPPSRTSPRIIPLARSEEHTSELQSLMRI